MTKTKLNLGCGTNILLDYLNLDVSPLPGVDTVWDLAQYPWPLPSNHFAEIRAVHLLEHLPDTIKTMEELWRISAEGARIMIRTPYWNCWHSIGDPTHKRSFHQNSLDFFDPRKRSCRERPYYSRARFLIEKIYYWRPLFRERGWIRIRNPILKSLMGFFAHYINNIIWVLEFELRAVKPAR